MKSGALLCLLGPLWALLPMGAPAIGERIDLGLENGWEGWRLSNVDTTRGYRDTPALRLRDAEYSPDDTTELLLHFDNAIVRDAALRYRVTEGAGHTTNRLARLGSGAGLFRRAGGGLTLAAAADGDALFLPGNHWGDFSIEFWLYPLVLSEGATIVRWQGARIFDTGAAPIPQELRVWLRAERLQWDFTNLFASISGVPFQLRLVGRNGLLPRVWRHHKVRFDSRSGILEYSIDGVPEDIAWATADGREGSSVYTVGLGVGSKREVVVGGAFDGLIDELRITRTATSAPLLRPIAAPSGVATSEPIALGSEGGYLTMIDARYSTPDDTAIDFYYRTATRSELVAGSETGWIAFRPGEALTRTTPAHFVSLRVELHPDGLGAETPRLSSLSLRYEPFLPPPPPLRVTAQAEDGRLHLSWLPAPAPDEIALQFRVHIGRQPQRYLERTIDAGASTAIELDGLANGRAYYIVVESYDPRMPESAGGYSTELVARPRSEG